MRELARLTKKKALGLAARRQLSIKQTRVSSFQLVGKHRAVHLLRCFGNIQLRSGRRLMEWKRNAIERSRRVRSERKHSGQEISCFLPAFAACFGPTVDFYSMRGIMIEQQSKIGKKMRREKTFCPSIAASKLLGFSARFSLNFFVAQHSSAF
jgi:hypothetical protein